ncbi:response regulator [Planktothricoides raciborskii]|uniref:Response regulator n=1 Tax=Planktothricoides raciborskii FACHB-1370 TaxID=2949576 RepID=A0ABR8ENZ5_9CYAN|nr:response regulator [Planktothricoides raciborskii]MBD2547620.1 response regulator [Planktothricoides raciborskii FACHB-1370]MBD2586059.1 response regulator [Planktothricoides raciborskii FACHB-1261]
MNTRLVEVLLVEDDEAEADLTRETLQDQSISVKLNTVEDGIEAMAYLLQKGEYANAVRPDVILLDLNMPKKDGREVLKELKNDDNFKHIPVLVLTNSSSDKDILIAYQLGANCYLKKPILLDEFAHVLKLIDRFWFNLVTLPIWPTQIN